MSGNLYPNTTAVQNRYVKILYEGLNSQYTEDNSQLVLKNIDAVNNQILNLITIMPGELDFEPDVGSQIPLLLFEQPSTVASWMIENYLFVAIARWLPYVSIDFRDSLITPLLDEAGYYFRLEYSVAGIVSGQANFRFQT